jgi:hypothetical protein
MDSLEIKNENRGRPPKPLSKEMILAAMSQTKSNKAAARWLAVSYIHYKKWAKNYTDEETGLTLFEKHKNQSGKGIPKFWRTGGKKGDPDLMEIIEGRVNVANFNPNKIKYRLVAEGYMDEVCSNCKFNERRVLDYKIPLLLHFKDKNKKNWKLENLELLCYNCFFLSVGDIFTNKQIEGMETPNKPVYNDADLELDDYQLERLKGLGLDDVINTVPSGSEDYISYIV